MFDNSEFPKSLDEEVFDQWLEAGRKARTGYHYLLVVWDDYDSSYKPVYVEQREEISAYRNPRNRERFIAAYDLYSESRIL
jgi:hypothetical protein